MHPSINLILDEKCTMLLLKYDVPINHLCGFCWWRFFTFEDDSRTFVYAFDLKFNLVFMNLVDLS